MADARSMTSGSLSLVEGQAFRGQRIGKYEILTRLTLGGMAELFLAFTSGPGGFRKFVVVKRILPDVRSDDQFVKMFLDEARITAAMNHPNIAQVFDLGEEESGLFLAMEFIAGQNLNQIAHAQSKTRVLLPVGFCAAVGRDLCQALHYAHTFTDPTGRPLPVIHRDVAQKNVMVTYDGVTKLLDFGIAKARGSLGRTSVGMVKGTTGYMSPEQVQGHALDGRSDLFSLGVVLHEMLTGKRLFSAATEEEEMRKILSGPIPTPRSLASHVPEALSDVVMRSLARDRKDRYPNGKEMARALEGAMGSELFDLEETGKFVRGLFSEKMAATRALMQAAGSSSSEDVHTALTYLRKVSDKEETARSVDSQRSPKPVKTALPPKPAPSALHLPERMRNTKEALIRVMRRQRIAGGLVLVLVAGGVLAFVLRSGGPDPGLPPPAEHPRASDLKVFTAQPGSAPARLETHEPSEARRPMGTLSLVTYPPCIVLLGKRELGLTPFSVPLPAGSHLLQLKDPTGVVHPLQVRIRPGKTTFQRLDL